MNTPQPTPIYRLVHVENLPAILARGAVYAPNCTPDDGLHYRAIHNIDIQQRRREIRIGCGPGGVVHDYVAFYFGPRSPMLFQLHTGWVPGYCEGQEPLIYLVTTVQAVARAGAAFVFSDGHGIARFTRWFDSAEQLAVVDWDAVYATEWKDTSDDMDRQRRKQAEFLVHERCDWALVREIGVVSEKMKARVETIVRSESVSWRPPVSVRPEWYY